MDVTTQTLGDAFARCDAEWLARVLLRNGDGGMCDRLPLTRRRYRSVVRSISDNLEVMRLARPSGDGSDQLCFLPRRRYRLIGRRIVCDIKYLCCGQNELQMLADDTREAWDECRALEVADRCQRGEKLRELTERRRERLRTIAWPRALAGSVIIVDELSTYEQYGFLAEVYADLTAREGVEGFVLGVEPPSATSIGRAAESRSSDGIDKKAFADPPPNADEKQTPATDYERALDGWVRELNGMACWEPFARLIGVDGAASTQMIADR